MEPDRVSVFFYGLFMDADLLISKGAHPARMRTACAPGFALRIGQRATLVPDGQSCAYGVVMELSQADIERLYSEASVSAYRPKAVLAQMADGSFVAALCFNLVVPPAPEEANSEYAKKLRDLARRLKLPSAYVESIH
jgi:Gamma-glutamyl cyclotransferase, AIG2-like